MHRKLAALACLLALTAALSAAAAHDHLRDQGPEPHACLLCAPALEGAEQPLPPPDPQACPASDRLPLEPPFVPSPLNPCHSGNAPPAAT